MTVLRLLALVSSVLNAACVFAQPLASSMTDDTAPLPLAWREDADLADVFFVDAQYGWAVGGLGAIWHTDDGGEHWRLQASPTASRLTSVCFIDRSHGWAVGGRSDPITLRSSGQVLKTADGGKTWELIQGLLLPALANVQFDSEKVGWAAGQFSALLPTSVFRTADGGRTWNSLSAESDRQYVAASWLSGAGLLVDHHGRVDVLTDRRVQHTAALPFRILDHNATTLLLTPSVGFVGDGGRPWLTVNGGMNWQRVGTLPEQAERQFRIECMALIGNDCWLAGSPGTVIWKSTDNARTWSGGATGQPLPIHDIHFVDHHRGWTAGARGTILATQDGGRTWQRQRGGNSRAAVMGCYARVSDVPWELVAKLSAADDYRVHVDLLGEQTPAHSFWRTTRLETRFRDAVASLGASGGSLSKLSLPEEALQMSAEQIASAWDTTTGEATESRLAEQIVRQIRVWRPDAFITSDARASQDGAAQLVERLVRQAVELAADDKAFPQQLDQTGLQPWKVSRVFVEDRLPKTDSDGTNEVVVNPQQLAIGLGRTLASLAFDARTLCSPKVPATSKTRSFRRLEVQAGRHSLKKTSNLLDGMTVPYDSAARRNRTAPTNLSQLRNRAQQQRNIEALLGRGDKIAAGDTHLWQQASRLIEPLEARAAGRVLYELGARFEASGNLPLAAEVHDRLTSAHPKHALAAASFAWLASYRSSAELAWRRERRKQPAVRLVSNEAPSEIQPVDTLNRIPRLSPGAAVAGQPGRKPGEGGLEPELERTAATPSKYANETITLVNRLRTEQPALYAQPLIRLPLAAAYRSTGNHREAQSIYRSLLASPAESPWRAIAASELAREKATEHTAAQWQCHKAAHPPYLDGVLDDELWQAAETVTLGGSAPTGEQATTAMIACDAEYLYFAARCPKVADVTYIASVGTRTRDADLSSQDRIMVMLDINRDYSSFWQLSVDHRGWTRESILTDVSWNPNWYVAAAADDEHWTIELAIPLEELCPDASPAGAWTVNVQRVIPGHGIEAWQEPAGVTPRPEGFRLLTFGANR